MNGYQSMPVILARSKIVSRFLLLTAFGFAGWCWSSPAQAQQPENPAPARFEFIEPHMGVSFKIVLYAVDMQTANNAATAAFERISQLNSLLSDYDAQSELSRLSDSAGLGKAVPVSAEMWAVLLQADKVSQLSEGAFDVTVGPVVKLWRRARRSGELPSKELLAEVLQLVGYQQIRLDGKARTVELHKTGMRLDLGGIAKGYAADEAILALRKLGINQALVAASGDVVVGDAPPGKTGWQVAIAPLNKDQPTERLLTLANCAVSTSGDAFQFVEIDGQRYSHIVNPRTGMGLTTRSSVTVVAEKGMLSDSLASAVCVLGPESGMKLIESLPEVAALIVLAQDEATVSEFRSTEMQKLLPD